MKLITVERKTKTEKRYAPNIGILTANVVYVKKKFLNIPIKTLYKYRETYYGEVKECKDCRLIT